MDIKIITRHDVFVDAVANDCDLLKWAENWILENESDIDIEFYNNGHISIINNYITFSGDNGIFELEIITKTI